MSSRGLLELQTKDLSKKDKETYELVNQSSFLNKADHEALAESDMALNQELIENTQETHLVEFDPATIKYKAELLAAYRGMSDPFAHEITGDIFDYEQNPSDPSHPQKTVGISPYQN